MTGRRVLRCWRELALIAFLAAFALFIFVFCLAIMIRGELPDYSFPRVLGMIGILAAALACTAGASAALRRRVIMDGNGIEVVSAFRRRRLPWAEIEQVTLRSGWRAWLVCVRTAEREHRVFAYPVTVLASSDDQRYESAPPHTPWGLRRLYGRLREEWEARRAVT